VKKKTWPLLSSMGCVCLWRVGFNVKIETKNFEEKFRRSRSGNLFRRMAGLTLVVFKRKDGESFGWLICDGDCKEWSRGSYAEEEEALAELKDYLIHFFEKENGR